MINKIKVLLLLLLAWGGAKAQSDIPVDLHTGRPSIVVPLHQVRSGDIVVPLALVYDAGGVRVDGYSNPDHVGVNWSLVAGGSITRHVRSLPDDYTSTNTSDLRRGWLIGTGGQAVKNFIPPAMSSCSEGPALTFFQSTVGYTQDTEPDVFSFQFGSFSGQFVFDNDKQVRAIPFQDFSIKINDRPENDGAITSQINNIQITTNDGTIYKFEPVQRETKQITNPATGLDFENNVYYLKKDYKYFTQAITYNTKWGLSEIFSPGGGKVSFTYSLEYTEPTTNTPKDVYVRKGISGDLTFTTKTLYWTTSTLIKRKLNAITASLWDRVQIDYSSVAGTVTGISIFKDHSAPVKKYLFTYQSASDQRNWLTSVQAIVDAYQKEPPYTFEYNGVNFSNYKTLLPPANAQSYAQDVWGYYNGVTTNTTLYPTIYVYAGYTASERYRIQPIVGVAPTHTLHQGANRSVNPDAVTAGMLDKITYPTGGHTRLYYGSNKYYDSVTKEVLMGGGVRVNAVITHDGISYANDIVKRYEYDSTQARLLNRPQFVVPVSNYKEGTSAVYDINSSSVSTVNQQFELFTVRTGYDLNPYLFDNPNVVYQKVTEKQTGKGRSEYTFQLPLSYGSTATSQASDWEATTTLLARFPYMNSSCFTVGKLERGHYVYPFPTNTNYGFERGLLSNIKEYNEAKQLLREKTYTYQRLNKAASPVQIYGVAFEAYRYDIPNYGATNVFAYGRYKLLADVTKVTSIEKETVYDPTQLSRKTESAKSSFYESQYHRMLSRTSTTTSQDGVSFTTYGKRYKYPKDYPATSSTDETLKALELLKAKANATVVEEIATITKPGEVEKVTGARLTLPKWIPGTINRALPGETWVMQTNVPVPLADFKGLEVYRPDGTQGSNIDSRYRFGSRIEEYNAVGHVVTASNRNKMASAVLWDATGERALAAVGNAKASQVVYSGFDEKYYDGTGAPEWQAPYGFEKGTGYTLVAGRIGQAISIPAGFAFQKYGVTKGIGDTYTFSCWVKATTSGNMTVSLSNTSSPGTAVVSSSINFSAGNTWTYNELKLPVTALQSSFIIKVTTNAAVTVDDMLFYPSMASVSLSAYNLVGKIAETDTYGFTTFNTYDGFGRLTLVRDQDNNILKRQIYNYREKVPLNPYISITSPAYTSPANLPTGTSISFKTGSGGDPSGVTYTWNFGDGTATVTGTTPSKTYYTAGEYTVTLTATHPQYGSATSKLAVTVRQPTNFSLCVSGIITYDLCNNEIKEQGTTCTSTEPLGTNTFEARIISGCGTSYQYKWERAPRFSEDWVVLPQTTSKITIQVQPSGTPIRSSDSYKIRCTVTPNCLGTTVSSIQHITFLGDSCDK